MLRPGALDPDIGSQLQPLPDDAAIAALAARQHGVVERGQLIALGLRPGAVDRRTAAGRLHRMHRGVYAVGHPAVTREGRWMAGVLASGRDAVLSHLPAAALWDLRPASDGRIEVTVSRSLRPRRGLKVHRTVLAMDERTVRDGIPVTTATRTLLDLAAVLSRPGLERACEQAEALRLTDGPSLDELIERHPRRKGALLLRAIVGSGRVGIITRSELEARFLTFVADLGLPVPHTNARIEAGGRWLEVDCLWPESRVVVELDGHAFHSTRAAFERDRERDRLLQAAGWRVVRITWRQLRDEPAAVARDLARLLRHAVALDRAMRG